MKHLRPPFVIVFSRESDSTIANVRLSVCPSVCPSVRHRNPSASKNHAYQPNLMPINHHANQPPCPPPQSLRIITIGQNATQPPCPPSQSLRTITIGQNAYQPLCPYSLPTYALLSRLLSHFGLFGYSDTMNE